MKNLLIIAAKLVGSIILSLVFLLFTTSGVLAVCDNTTVGQCGVCPDPKAVCQSFGHCERVVGSCGVTAVCNSTTVGQCNICPNAEDYCAPPGGCVRTPGQCGVPAAVCDNTTIGQCGVCPNPLAICQGLAGGCNIVPGQCGAPAVCDASTVGQCGVCPDPKAVCQSFGHCERVVGSCGVTAVCNSTTVGQCNICPNAEDYCAPPGGCVRTPGQCGVPAGPGGPAPTIKVYDPTCGGNDKVITALGCVPVNPEDFTDVALPWSIGIGAGIAFLLGIYGAGMIVLSAGNPEKMQAGKELITSAIAGVLILVFAVFLLDFIGVKVLKLFTF